MRIILYTQIGAYFDLWERILLLLLLLWSCKTRHVLKIVSRVFLPVFCFYIILERLHHRPVFTEAPHNLTLVLGGSGVLACKVLSDLHPYIGWYIGEITVENAENLNLTSMVKVEVRLGNDRIELFG